MLDVYCCFGRALAGLQWLRALPSTVYAYLRYPPVITGTSRIAHIRPAASFNSYWRLPVAWRIKKVRSGGLLTIAITTRIRIAKLKFTRLANMAFGGLIVYGFFRSAFVKPTRNSWQVLRNTLNCVCWISFTLCHPSSRPLYFSCSA